MRWLRDRLPGLAATLLVALPARAATYYVAPGGNDGNAGTEASPFASMAKGQSVAAAGDTVYFKGGTYSYTKGTTTCASGTDTISGVVLSKSGAAGNLIKYWAAPGEKPVFDFSGILDSCRIKGILVSGSYIHLKGIELEGVRQNNDLNHESWGVWVQGSNNVFETLDIHNIMGAGLFIQQGGGNLVLNCDSHHNFDEHTSNGPGESGDGFGCHIRASDSGNVFRGCRAWWNSDDGFDFINAFNVCTVESSWTWYNGYRPDTMTAAGNGNGFKAGGYGLDPSTFPASPPQHIVRNCLAFLNRAAGFYANHHPGSPYFYDDTGYGNHPNFNMLGMSTSGADTTVGVYRNDLAFSGTLFSNRTSADDAFNSWTVSGITVSDADFQSVAPTGMDAPRQADGSLPAVPNFHLAQGSDLIDKGTNVNLPFAGSAPDLGCFETGLAASGGSSGIGGTSGTATGGAGATAGGVTGAGGTNGVGGTTTPAGGASSLGGAPSANAGAGNIGAGGGSFTPGSGGASNAAPGGSTMVGAAGTTSASGSGTSGASAAGAAPSSGDGTPGDASGCTCSTAPHTGRPGIALGSLLLIVLAFCRIARRRTRMS